MGPLGYPELVVIALIGFFFLSLAFWIWMLVDCIIHEPAEGNEKLTWVIIIALTGAIGALIYLLARRPTRKRLYGR
ncbi:MAG: PLDc N-terminal domain-containing protein [Akkermansiaceae bacterium]|nr:PLDc N-terminal domain-containing protein [Akkermansiaceae bacterium]